MARKRKRWSYAVGRYGATVRIWEPRLGAPLRWYYRDGGRPTRPAVQPEIRVRRTPDDPVDPVLERKARDRCDQQAALLVLEPLRKSAAPERLTVGDAYRLYFDPRRKALPPSRQARVNHSASRRMWVDELGEGTLWDAVQPADVWAALLRLREAGRIPTATKRLQNLRTLYRWLRDMMGYDLLRDPTRGLDVRKLREGYTPRRPRLQESQRAALRRVLPDLGWRTRLFFTLLLASGTRAVQARHAKRSGIDAPLEPPPPASAAPHGWIVLRPVKGQRPHVTFLTRGQRAEIDAVLAGPLADWEAEYQAGERSDFWLLPGGKLDQEGRQDAPVSDRALRYELDDVFGRAGIVKKERMGFHAVRRSWADMINESLGLDVARAAGGWSRRETVEESYLAPVQHGMLEQARLRMEDEEGG